jgi:hypothetical protein
MQYPGMSLCGGGVSLYIGMVGGLRFEIRHCILFLMHKDSYRHKWHINHLIQHGFFFLLFFCTHLTVIQPQKIYMMDTSDITLDLVESQSQ